LGAVAHQDLMAALGGQQPMQRGYGRAGGSQPGYGQFDPARAEKVMGGLLGGPATNVVKIWYTYRDQIPDELRKKLKDIARRLLIDLGQRYAKATMGSSMLGGIQQSTTVRPFRIGDDIDLIDLEETIESILSSGRSDFDALNAEDFLITETYQGHRAFYWALDKSGSMHSPNKLGMLAISVMAGLYGVQKDDFGVVLFDSDTHIVKEIADKTVSVDKVAADLLEVRASGGTGGQTAMKLALQNFEDTRSKEKIFIFSTDAYLSDQQECEKLAVQMKHQDIQLILLAPRFEYDVQAADKLAKLNHGVVLDIASIEELPEKLLRLTNY
ncbi:MAG: vWA domain-containing protein, partial [Candidatus Thorarchaeota archaeon]